MSGGIMAFQGHYLNCMSAVIYFCRLFCLEHEKNKIKFCRQQWRHRQVSVFWIRFLLCSDWLLMAGGPLSYFDSNWSHKESNHHLMFTLYSVEGQSTLKTSLLPLFTPPLPLLILLLFHLLLLSLQDLLLLLHIPGPRRWHIASR